MNDRVNDWIDLQILDNLRILDKICAHDGKKKKKDRFVFVDWSQVSEEIVIYSQQTLLHCIYYGWRTVLGTGVMTHKISVLNTGLQGWGGGLEDSVGMDRWPETWGGRWVGAGWVGGSDVKTKDILSSKWNGNATIIWWVGKG